MSSTAGAPAPADDEPGAAVESPVGGQRQIDVDDVAAPTNAAEAAPAAPTPAVISAPSNPFALPAAAAALSIAITTSAPSNPFALPIATPPTPPVPPPPAPAPSPASSPSQRAPKAGTTPFPLVALPPSRTSMDGANSVRRAVRILATAFLGWSIAALFVGVNYISSALLIGAASAFYQLSNLPTLDFVQELGEDAAVATPRGTRSSSPCCCSCRCLSRLDSALGLARAASVVALLEFAAVVGLGFLRMWPSLARPYCFTEWGNPAANPRDVLAIVPIPAPPFNGDSGYCWYSPDQRAPLNRCTIACSAIFGFDAKGSGQGLGAFLQTMFPAAAVVATANFLWALLAIALVRELGVWALRQTAAGEAADWGERGSTPRSTASTSSAASVGSTSASQQQQLVISAAHPVGLSSGGSSSSSSSPPASPRAAVRSPRALILSVRSPLDGAESLRVLMRTAGAVEIVAGSIGFLFSTAWISSLLLVGQGGLLLELTATPRTFLRTLGRDGLLGSREGRRLSLCALNKHIGKCGGGSPVAHLLNLSLAALAFMIAELALAINGFTYTLPILQRNEACGTAFDPSPATFYNSSTVVPWRTGFCASSPPTSFCSPAKCVRGAQSFYDGTPTSVGFWLYVGSLALGTLVMIGVGVLWAVVNRLLLAEASYWAIADATPAVEDEEVGEEDLVVVAAAAAGAAAVAPPASRAQAAGVAVGVAAPAAGAEDGGSGGGSSGSGEGGAMSTTHLSAFGDVRAFVLQTLTREERVILRTRGAVSATGGALSCVSLTPEEADAFVGVHLLECIQMGLVTAE
jgi:hypothetical protein